jgi:hypothetical protein
VSAQFSGQSYCNISPKGSDRLLVLRQKFRLARSKNSRLNQIVKIIGWDFSDWQWLLCFPLLADKIYIYDHSTLSARKSAPGEVPWQILWYLTRFHKKHRFSRDRPKLETLIPYLASFEAKVRWQYKFRDKVESVAPIRVPTRFTAKAPVSDSPGLENFLSNFRSTALRAYNKSIIVASAKKPGNITALAKLGHKLLRASGLSAAPTDKDGGYAIMPKDVYENAHQAILESASYKHSAVNDWTSLANWYCRLTKRIQQFANSREKRARLLELTQGINTTTVLQSTLNKSIMLADNVFVSTLQITCKTHKSPGKVTFRNIHASAGWRFQGLSMWVAGELRKILTGRSSSHILKDSQDFVERLRTVKLRPNQLMVKVDVKDFFMSGTPSELTKPILESLPTTTGEQRTYNTLLSNVLDFLLENQYICSPFSKDKVYQVIKGTGMGLFHSGDLADTALYFLSESKWACNPDIQIGHGIDAFYRFKDDIFCIVDSSTQKWEHFLMEYGDRSSCFKMELEDVSEFQVTYLDLLVTKGKRGYKATPYIKPSNLGIPLGIQSAHPLSVHTSWPKGVLHRLSTLTNSMHDLEQVKCLFVERLRQSFHHPVLTQQVANLQLNTHLVPRKNKTCVRGKDLWCVLPFHPALKSVMTRELHKFYSSHEARMVMSQLFGEAKGLRVCWANTLPSHMSLVRSA